MRLLYDLGCAFAARIDLDELSAFVVRQCREVLDAEGAAILLCDRERNELYFPYVADVDTRAGARVRTLRFPADRGIAGAVLRDGKPLRIDDAATDPRFYRGVDRESGVTTRALLCAPLRSHQGTIGVVQVLNPRSGGCFNDDQLAFLDALAGSVAVAIDNARMYAQLKEQYRALQQAMHEHEQLLAIRRELDIARGIQQSILPQTFPPFPERKDIDVFAQMSPAREVGGDFYDFFLLDAARLGFVVGDVSGKGVPAALFMAVSRTLLKAVALGGVPPDECLRRVNTLLCLDNSAEMFVSVFYGILDIRSGEMLYSNGGHNPPYLLRRTGAVESLAGTGGTVLGVLDNVRCASRSVTVQAGDGVFLYSDGVTEAMDVNDRPFSDARLRAVLQMHKAGAAETLVRGVIDDLLRYTSGAPQSDDITALAIRYRGA